MFRVSPFFNRNLLIATASAFLAHPAALYIPFTRFILRMEPISLDAWLRLIPIALAIFVVVELHKLTRGEQLENLHPGDYDSRFTIHLLYRIGPVRPERH